MFKTQILLRFPTFGKPATWYEQGSLKTWWDVSVHWKSFLSHHFLDTLYYLNVARHCWEIVVLFWVTTLIRLYKVWSHRESNRQHTVFIISHTTEYYGRYLTFYKSSGASSVQMLKTNVSKKWEVYVQWSDMWTK